MMSIKLGVAIIGAGPAGLTAAYALLKKSPAHQVRIVEAGSLVGGIARTESHAGFRFDIGGHRFFTKVPEVQQIWEDVGGDDFLTRPRQSRIYFNQKLFDYPLKIGKTLALLGLVESSRIVASYVKWRLFPYRVENTLEEWVTNRFGERLYLMFFKTYTEKVWGVPCTEIRADWAAQRIKNLSLSKALWNALTGANDTASLIEKFQYPRLGPGMMWEKMRDVILGQGAQIDMNTSVLRVRRDGNHVTGLEVEHWGAPGAKEVSVITADHYVSSMALRDMILCMDPAPPSEVSDAARKLKYRDFLIVVLILDCPAPFPDNWIYIHAESVKVGRIQNFAAWSEEMVPNPNQASIGMEYFLNVTDAMWTMPDADLIAMAAAELEAIGLGTVGSVVDGAVIRQPKTYPVYDANYQDALSIIRDWIGQFDNLQTVGRNGLHRYNNQDHSMLTGILAAHNILGEANDLWNVNVERSYHEEFKADAKPVTLDAA